jgi:hypothetical protein
MIPIIELTFLQLLQCNTILTLCWRIIGTLLQNQILYHKRLKLNLAIVTNNNNEQGGSAMLNYYSGSPKRALLHLFPHIGLQESLFGRVSSKSYKQGTLVLILHRKSLGCGIKPKNLF